jgi:hypothetical protein
MKLKIEYSPKIARESKAMRERMKEDIRMNRFKGQLDRAVGRIRGNKIRIRALNRRMNSLINKEIKELRKKIQELTDERDFRIPNEIKKLQASVEKESLIHKEATEKLKNRQHEIFNNVQWEAQAKVCKEMGLPAPPHPNDPTR